MPRKTVPVAAIVEAANTYLAMPDKGQPDGVAARTAIIWMVEGVLFAADQYKGFRYLPTECVEPGGALRPDYDDTRRRYYA